MLLVASFNCGGLASMHQQVAFDDQQKVVYLAGGSQLSALDASTDALPDISSSSLAAALPLLAQQKLPASAADVAVCGGLVAVAAESVRGKAAPGQLLLFKAHDRSAAAAADSTEDDKPFHLLANVTVGEFYCHCNSQSLHSTHCDAPPNAGFCYSHSDWVSMTQHQHLNFI
jgi:hypothetical protein